MAGMGEWEWCAYAYIVRMTPESRNSLLLYNGSQIHVSAATDKLVETRSLLRN
jgi:hypothetical protein